MFPQRYTLIVMLQVLIAAMVPATQQFTTQSDTEKIRKEISIKLYYIVCV